MKTNWGAEILVNLWVVSAWLISSMVSSEKKTRIENLPDSRNDEGGWDWRAPPPSARAGQGTRRKRI